MKLSVTPTYDSYNSSPPDVTFQRHNDGVVTIRLLRSGSDARDDREIIIAKEDWDAICQVFPGSQ
jgi:hypothetical protein